MSLVTRYQDVIEELFWVNNTFQNPGTVRFFNKVILGDVIMKTMAGTDAAESEFEVTEFVTRRLLDTAAPYFIDTHVHELVQSAAVSLPLSTRITESMWPTPSGYARWQDTSSPKSLKSVGFGWTYLVMPDNVLAIGKESNIGRALFMVNLAGIYPPLRRLSCAPVGLLEWYQGLSIGEMLDLYREQEVMKNHDDYTVVENAFRYAASLALFMEQEIFVHTRSPADRTTRRRLEHSHGAAKVAKQIRDCLVVRLRRVYHPHQNDHDTPRDHDFRWWVAGHWRVLYRGLDKQRTVWVRPHIKGPDDKPVKAPSMRVFEVSR